MPNKTKTIIEDLEAQIAEIDARAAKAPPQIEAYRTERDQLIAQLDAATLGDDPLMLAAAQIRARLLTGEIDKLENQLQADARLRSNLNSTLGDEENRLNLARRLVADVMSGLDHPRIIGMDIRMLLRDLDRARTILERAGEPAAPIAITL